MRGRIVPCRGSPHASEVRGQGRIVPCDGDRHSCAHAILKVGSHCFEGAAKLFALRRDSILADTSARFDGTALLGDRRGADRRVL